MKNKQLISARTILCVAALFGLIACNEPVKEKQTSNQPETAQQPEEEVVPALQFSLVKVHPHDSSAFTEGLFFYQGKLYESTGSPNNIPSTRSTIGIVNKSTGILDVKIEIDKRTYFGEGAQIVNGKLFQLTYQNQTGFVYDAKTFKKLSQFNYPNKEGWGLTTDGTSLIMSDGSSQITFIDPDNFAITKKLIVTESGYECFNLNELEYLEGFIYANIWMTNRIVKIDAATGKIVASADMSNLFEQARRRYPALSEMNGIAYDPESKHFFVTGKMWATMYELDFTK